MPALAPVLRHHRPRRRASPRGPRSTSVSYGPPQVVNEMSELLYTAMEGRASIRQDGGSRLVVESERHQRMVRTRTGGDHDELFAGTRSIGHRRRTVGVRQGAAPHLATGFLVEGIQVLVAAADKYQAAASHNRTALAVGSQAI